MSDELIEEDLRVDRALVIHDAGDMLVDVVPLINLFFVLLFDLLFVMFFILLFLVITIFFDLLAHQLSVFLNVESPCPLDAAGLLSFLDPVYIMEATVEGIALDTVVFDVFPSTFDARSGSLVFKEGIYVMFLFLQDIFRRLGDSTDFTDLILFIEFFRNLPEEEMILPNYFNF